MTRTRIVATVVALTLVGAAAAVWWLTATVLEASSVLLELVARSLEESS